MKRKLLSFSMALCLSAMGVSAFAQTTSPTFEQSDVNKYASTLKREFSGTSFVDSYGDAARYEINDNILGSWTSATDDNRSSSITLSAWVKFTEADKGASTETNGIWFDKDGSSLSAGRILLGHRQGHIGGYGSEPSFSISVVGPNKMSIFTRLRNSSNGYDGISSTEQQSLVESAVDIPKGWFHLALTASVTRNTSDENYTLSYNMYVNGALKQSFNKTDYTNSKLPYLPDNVKLTGKIEGGDFAFDSGLGTVPEINAGCDICIGGNMTCDFDDIMIWTTALGQSDIKESMYGYDDTQLETAEKNGLVGYYLCDDLLGADHDAYSANVVSAKEEYPLVLQSLYYAGVNQQYVEFAYKKPSSKTLNYEVTDRMNYPRGGAKFYTDLNGSSEVTWLRNGDENFGYAINTEVPLYRLDYNGTSISQLDSKYMAVYYNANYDVRAPKAADSTVADDYQSGVPVSVTSSYVATGFEYTVKMPSIARKWFTIGFPTEVDLAYYFANGNTGTAEQDVWLRPNYNFWYNEFNPEYQSTEDNMWNTVSATGEDDRYYKLANGGTFAVTEDFVDGTFTFYSTENSPVVFRAENAEYNQSLLPASGKLGFVANPYMESIDASVLCPGCTAYQLDDNGLFWPVDKLTVGVFDGVLVYNGNADSAPKAVNTKTTTGVLELEALSDINVRGAKESIEVVTFEPATVTVYTVGGTMVANSQVEGTETFALPAGIYVVKAVAGSETETFKVVVE